MREQESTCITKCVPYSVLSLFCGAGGLDLGFEAERFRLLEAIDINPWCVKTLQNNRPNWRVILGDILYRGLTVQLRETLDSRLAIQLVAGVVGSAIAIFFFFSYVLGIELTREARYHFVYFPAVIPLVGASLAACWRVPSLSIKIKTPKPPILLFNKP